jgi:hypothetical protein
MIPGRSRRRQQAKVHGARSVEQSDEFDFSVDFGFVISSASGGELSSLRDLFNILTTTAAFICGVIAATFASVSLEELEAANIYNPDDAREWGADLCFTSCIGICSSAYTLVTTVFLYVSISFLNMGEDGHQRIDLLLRSWVKKFKFLIASSLVGLCVSVMSMILCMFYTGLIKYSNLAGGSNTNIEDKTTFLGIGSLFTLGLVFTTYYIVVTHKQFVSDVENAHSHIFAEQQKEKKEKEEKQEMTETIVQAFN